MRAAITIIYNSIEDLNYRGFSTFMANNFDAWIIVDGSSKNGGSTGWCNSIKTNAKSTDGTLEFILKLQEENHNIHVFSQEYHYKSKDEQFNKGVEMLRAITDSCYLWQVDSDEHWNSQDLEEAEKMLSESEANVGEVQFNHYVINGDTVCVAVGEWGSSKCNRVWKWQGQIFERHEPAIMQGQTLPLTLPHKFEHFSYCFESKVKFKSLYYKDHENVYRNWRRLPHMQFPCHISQLFGKNSPVGKSSAYLHKIELPCVNATDPKAEKEVDNNYADTTSN